MLVFLTLLVSISIHGIVGKEKEPLVYEMDDRIIDFATQGKWLIQFYAPWCGHCKKLEPVFLEVGKYYKGHPMVTVAKVDATRFVKAAEHFEVRGYPTIKYVYGKTRVTFHGERRKEDLIEFVDRCDAPRVTKINHQLDFENTKHKNPLLFLLIMKPGEETSEMKAQFFELAEKYFLDSYFYHTKPEYMTKTAKVNNTPSVAVVRDNEVILYNPIDYSNSIERFIKVEMFHTFCEVTSSNFHFLMDTNKILLILLVNNEDMLKINQTRKIKQAFKIYSKTFKKQFRKEFQFGYTENDELLSSIAIWTLTSPVLFIFNSSSHQYALVEFLDKKNKIVEFDIAKILDDIRNHDIEFFGGKSILRSIRRPLWEIYRAILEMFVEAPFISLLIFGFPFGVISIVCYFMCCVDASDSPEEPDLSDSEAEEEHQDFLDEASHLLDSRKLEGEENRIKMPTSSKKMQ